MYQHILVATGGSPWSDAAVAYAIAIAARTDATLRILTVLLNPGVYTTPEVMGGSEMVVEVIELEGEELLDDLDFTRDLSCPLLGLFGREDGRPSPEDVAKTEEELKRFGKTYEFHMYDNAGHAFFSVDRPNFRVEAALDGWNRAFDWFGKHLG